VRIPDRLRVEWPNDQDWLAEVSGVVTELTRRWNLPTLEEPFDTALSLVIPAGDFVLKLNVPSHVESSNEADALAEWRGVGAARLVERDDEQRALLIERCRPGTRLWDTEADGPAAVAELLPRLWVKPLKPHRFALLAAEADRWANSVSERYAGAGAPFERRLLDYALDIFRTADRTAGWLVNQDLHGGNILRAEREPWLVIDPKPLVGEREANAVGLLRNAAFNGGPDSVRQWLDPLVDLRLDRERLRGWGVAHALAWGWSDDGGWSRKQIEAARSIFAA
jgi:streptomycin 6-kinase